MAKVKARPRTPVIELPRCHSLAFARLIADDGERLALASWGGGESLHGLLVANDHASVVIETAGRRFRVLKPAKGKGET